MASGGDRTPRNPAPASGPGKLARRTDGPSQKLMAPIGMDYGDRAGLLDQERTASMAQVASTPELNVPNAPQVPGGTARQQGGAPPAYTGVPFGAPTQRPNEPVTTGVDIGAGGGSEVLPPVTQPQFQAQGPLTRAMGSSGPLTGEMAAVYAAASNMGV